MSCTTVLDINILLWWYIVIHNILPWWDRQKISEQKSKCNQLWTNENRGESSPQINASRKKKSLPVAHWQEYERLESNYYLELPPFSVPSPQLRQHSFATVLLQSEAVFPKLLWQQERKRLTSRRWIYALKDALITY